MLVFKLKTHTGRPIWLGFALLYTLFLASIYNRYIESLGHLNWEVVFFIACLTMPYLFLAYKLNFFRTPAERTIHITDNHLQVWHEKLSKPVANLNFSNLVAMDVRGRGQDEFCTLQTDEDLLVFSCREFKNAKFWAQFLSTLENYQSKYVSSYILEQIAIQNKISQRIFNGNSYFPKLLVLFLTLVFIIQDSSRGTAAHWLIASGAANTELFLQGDYFRLFSGSILHSGYLHFASNIVVLFVLLFLINGLAGTAFTFSIYTISQLFGLFVALAMGQNIILGTSAGIYGLIGCYAYICQRYSSLLPAGLCLSKKSWLYFVFSNLLIVYWFPNVSLVAHVCGFASGYIISLFLFNKFDFVSGKFKNQIALRCVSGLLCLALGAQALAYINYLKSPAVIHAHNFSALKLILDKSAEHSADSLNTFAWEIAIDPKVKKQSGLLELARIASTKSLTLVKPESEDLLAYTDTLATVEYRAGDAATAIGTQGRLLKKIIKRQYLSNQLAYAVKSENYQAQLYRFMKALPYKSAIIKRNNRLIFSNRSKLPKHTFSYVFLEDLDSNRRYSLQIVTTEEPISYLQALPKQMHSKKYIGKVFSIEIQKNQSSIARARLRSPLVILPNQVDTYPGTLLSNNK